MVTSHTDFKVVEITEVINAMESTLFHLKSAAQWLTDNGPAPRTLDEQWTMPQRDMRYVFLLIYYQAVFFGLESLSPWQYNYYADLLDDVCRSNQCCMLCRMLVAPWCTKVVVRS